ALERVSELLRGASLDGSALRPLGEVGLGGRRTLRLRQLSEPLSLLPDGVLVTAGEEHLRVLGGDLELGGDLPPQRLGRRRRGGFLGFLRGCLCTLAVTHPCGI